MLTRLICVLLLLVWPVGLLAQDSDRTIERYRQLVERRPGPGAALDRLWNHYDTQGKSKELIAGYRAKAKAGDASAGLVLGYLLEKSGDPAAARRAFQQVAKTAPEDPRPWQALALLERSADQPTAEANAWEEAAARTKPGREQARLLLDSGKAWVRAGKIEQAIPLWENALASRPDDPALHRQLAEAYANAGRIDAAAAQYEALTKSSDPYERVTALREKARLFQNAGRGDEAIAALRRALPMAAAGNWLREELTGELIRLHQRLGRVDELETAWQREVEENPRDRSLYLQLIALYHQTAQLDREREWLGRLVELMPEEKPYRLRFARLLERQNRLAEAADEYDRLLADDAENLELQLARADLDLRLGRTAAAVARLRPLASKNPEQREQVLAFHREHRLADPEEELLRQRVQDEPTEEHLRELAGFLFEHDRADDAVRTLHRLIELVPPAGQPAQWARLAEALDEKGQTAEAVKALRRALEREPEQADWLMRLAMLQKAQGDSKTALATARQAVETAAGTPREGDIDERFHRFLTDSNLTDTTAPAGEEGAKDSFAETLSTAVKEAPSPGGFVRLARWQMLDRAFPAALISAKSALELDESNLEARKLALHIADAAGLYPEAVDQLEQLVRLDPAQADDYRRQIPEMKVRAGQAEAALKDYEKLLAKAPGDFNLLTAEARTLQSAERWLEALEAWRKAWGAGSLPEKRSLLPTLLQILQRLGRDDLALDLQLDMLDRETDPRSRESLLRDTMRLAAETAQGDRARALIEKRLHKKPQDVFLQTALAQALQTEGRADEALDLLTDASFATAEPELLLENIVALADAQGRYDLAIQTQQRLIWSRVELRAADFVKLAELQEQWLDLAVARRTWEEVVSRFGNDAALLKKAAGFYLRWQYRDRAFAVLQKLRRVDPSDRAALLMLAGLAEDEDQPNEALSAAEEVLQATPPIADDEAGWRFPESRAIDAGKLQQSYFRAAQLRRGMPDADVMQQMQAFWTGRGSTPAGTGNQRLEAIRLVAEIRKDRGEAGPLESWLRQWDRATASPIEALWAAYYAGDEERVMRDLQTLLEKDPRDLRVHQAFVWLTLQMRRFDALRTWLEQTRGQGTEFRDLFAVAFTQFQNEADPEELEHAVEKLFPEQEHSRLLIWQTATQLAAGSNFRLAGKLGERLLDQGGDALSQCAAEIGSWFAHAGEGQKARRAWRIGAQGVGDTFDDMRYENLRRYLLTLPPAKLRAYADQAEEAREGSAIHRAIVRVLANGLCRREAAARKALDELIAMRPLTADPDGTAAWRYWRFVLTAGVQMQMWGMNRLAVHLWDKAAGDEAALVLSERAAGAVINEIRLRRFGARLLELPPEAVGHEVALFQATSTADARSVFASLLEWVGPFRHGVEAMRALLEREPGNPSYLRTLLHVAGPSDVQTVLDCAMAGLKGSDSSTSQFALQYLDFFVEERAFDAAHAVLDRLGETGQNQAVLLERRAQLYVSQERWEEAAEVCARLQKLAGDSPARLAQQAEVLRRLGRIDEAIALLEQAPGPNALLAELYLEKKDVPAAIRCARGLIGEAATPELRPLAMKFADIGERRFAQVLLYGIAPDTGDFGGRIWNEAKALELVDPSTQQELRRQGMARLEAAATANRELRAFFYQALEKLLGSRTAYLQRLRTDWEAGLEGAGDALAEAVKTIEELPEDFSARASAAQLALLARGFRNRGDRETAKDFMTRALEKQPQQDDWRFELMDDLIAAGKREALPAHFEIIRVRSALNGSLIAPLARVMAKAGRQKEALAELEQATEWDTAGQDPDSLLAYAHLLMEKGQRSLASLYLRRAYRNTRTTDFAGAIEYVRAEAETGDPAVAMARIGLDPIQQETVRQALEESATAE